METSSGLVIESHPSEYCDARASEAHIDTLVIHSMYAAGASDPFSLESCKAVLDDCEVSAHYLIGREGQVWQLVAEEQRAWHAGVSCMPFVDDCREGVNHFSIGIELIGSEVSGFTDAQYDGLVVLTEAISGRYPLKAVVSHAAIAPERKTDPWCFDLHRYLEHLSLDCGDIRVQF